MPDMQSAPRVEGRAEVRPPTKAVRPTPATAGDATGSPFAACTLGEWSGWAVVVFSVGFSVPGLLALTGVVRFPWDPVLPYTSSLLLAGAFLAMMTALHQSVARDRVWTQLGMNLAVVYAVLAGIVYFVGTTVVVPLEGRGQGAQVALLRFDDDGSFMQALDGLAYATMCAATFAAAGALAGPADRWVRRIFVLNGVLGVPILLAYMPLVVSWGAWLMPVNALWILTVPLCGAMAARRFTRLKQTAGAASAT